MGHSHAHIYGQHWPSVTEILSSKPKPWLEAWKEKWGAKAVRKTELANVAGREFHRIVEQIVLGSPWETRCNRVRGMAEAFKLWPGLKDLKIVDTERKVWSEQYEYQGTLDCVGRIGKKLYVIDWKTSSGIYEDMGLQLSAYAEAYKEMTGRHIANGLIVLVSKKKPTYKLATREFKLGKRVFARFLKLRMEMPETVCTDNEFDDLP
jgi:ATP-dependent exoDNAse (exonuclease V) beta subunit